MGSQTATKRFSKASNPFLSLYCSVFPEQRSSEKIIRVTFSFSDLQRVNIAYIDATNLDKALRRDLGWVLDYKRFRVWLKERALVFQLPLFFLVSRVV